MNFVKKVLPYLSAAVSMVSTVSISYLADRVINTSQITFLALQTVLSATFYTPIMCFRKKMGDVKSIGIKKFFEILLFIEIPAFITEFSILKMYEKTIALPTAIFSSYPILNIIKSKLTPVTSYNLSSDVILINKSFKLSCVSSIKDLVFVGMYVTSIYLLFLDQKEEDTKDSDIQNAVIFASIATVSASICAHFTHKYGHKYEAEVLTYTGLLGAIPLRIAAATIGYGVRADSMNLKSDFLDNGADIRFIVPLSALNLVFLFTMNYAYSKIESDSDCAIFSTIVENGYALLLDKHFNFQNFTVYAFSGLALNILSCIGIIYNNRPNNVPEFFNVIMSKIERTDLDQVVQDIRQEWEGNKHKYDMLEPQLDLNLNSYNKTLLAILSKLILLDFNVVDRDGTIKLSIKNIDHSLDARSQVKIQTMFDLEEQQTTILVSEDNLRFCEEYELVQVVGES